MIRTNAAESLWRCFTRILLKLSLAVLLLVGTTDDSLAQSASAALNGLVVDTTGAVVSGAMVTATHEATASQRHVQTAGDGSFAITTLMPGRYLVVVSHRGFRSAELHNVVLNVDDRISLRVELAVGGVGEEVTVVSGAPRINTSPAVSTVIDRKFVENLPLNGRSFQALLQLTPGVILTPASTNQEGGQFSVNGQRSSENYFTIDGVSANAAASTSTGGFLGAAGSGQLPVMTTLGGTSGLVSVDALQEFRLQTSSYAPEFGRTAGGQISLVTRSGTNVLHGSAFEYFRDDAMDATDWFVKRAGAAKASLHQHNFGAVLGGPIVRNRTFAFGSYEGLRLLLPQAKTVTVPTLETRLSAAPVMQPFVNALPQPNGRDLGNGFAEYLGVYSDPSTLHSTSVRVDHNVGNALKLFGRTSYAPSYSETRGGSLGFVSIVEIRSRTGTIGATWLLSKRVVHDLRANVTSTEAPLYYRQAPIGGATLLAPIPIPSGRDPERTQLTLSLTGGGTAGWGPSVTFPGRQLNVVDSLALSVGSHEVKVGVDYRRTSSTTLGGGGADALSIDRNGLRSGIANSLFVTFYADSDRTAVFDNISLYAQDHWRLTSRLSLTYGVRWEIVPPPRASSGVGAATLAHTEDLYNNQVGLAPSGTPLWGTNYRNVAPRVGASYVVSENARKSLVIRGGAGTFYSLGYGQAANAFGIAYPYAASRSMPNVSLPVNAAALIVPPALDSVAPGQLWVMDRNVELPYTLQWSVSADQGIGHNRTLSVGYVGASGRRLLKIDRYLVSLTDFPSALTTVNVSRNHGYSDYQSLQMQFQQRLSRGIQAVASYTLGRSRDTGSSDATQSVPAERLPPQRDYGYSTFDIRHVFSAALTYQTSEPHGPRIWRTVARDWGFDLIMRSRSGSPLNLIVTVPFPPDTQGVRPNVVQGQPFWLDDLDAPGGRRLNRQAFSVPAAMTQGDLQRGTVRGFSMSQVDCAVRREFRLAGPSRMQLRIEAFNLFNNPNFADPIGTLTNANFGLSTQMLGRALGGQNVLYQMGGPRSIQIAAKLLF